ncbi:MAG: murein biosynthesis integral membrane protein MurJ [Phycisphaeraceae bacterium]
MTTPDAASPSFVGHAVLVSLFTLLSRFAGLARDAILAAALGLSVAADAFFIGFLVPNLFRRLFGEGALTAAFIPNYTDLLQRDPALAKRFATLTLTLLSVLLISITLLGELLLWWLASTIDPDHKASLAIQYTRVMLPYMPLICAVALIGGVLQVHKRFGPPAAVPLVLNGVIVVAVLLATGFFKRDTEPAIVATWVAVAVVIAGVLQLYWQAAVLFRVTGLSRSFKGCWPAMRSMLLLMGPMAIGLAVFQINALMDALIAFFFAPAIVPGLSAGSAADMSQQITLLGQTFDAPLRNGDVAALNWSQRLYQFPLGVFGIAIATAIFPALSAAAAKFTPDDDASLSTKPQAASEEFANIVRHGLRLTIFVALPATAGLMLVRVPLARTVFEHGSFTTEDALRVSVILAGYASSVWAYSMSHTLTRAFYALKDAKTPLKISGAMVLLNLTLNLSLIWSLGAAGLAWSTAISAALQVVLLVLLLRKRVDRPIDDSVINSWTRTMIATTAMAAVLFSISFFINPIELSWTKSAALLVGMVLLGMAVFFTIAKLTKAEELNWLRKRSVK